MGKSWVKFLLFAFFFQNEVSVVPQQLQPSLPRAPGFGFWERCAAPQPAGCFGSEQGAEGWETKAWVVPAPCSAFWGLLPGLWLEPLGHVGFIKPGKGLGARSSHSHRGEAAQGSAGSS